MKLAGMTVGETVTRPIWDGLQVKKTKFDEWTYIKNGKINTVLKSKSSAFKHDDFYYTELPKNVEKKPQKEKKMNSTDLLGEALLPIIENAIGTELAKQDFEAKIKSEISKAMGSIPQKTLTVIDTKGITRKMDLVHKQFETLLKMVNTKRPVLLKGEAGTAKSHNVEAVAKALGLDFYSMSVGEQSTKSDLLGYTDVQRLYKNTAFRKAFEQGGVFLLDEIDAGNPNVLLAINTGLSNGFIEFPDAEVRVHADFRCVATANTFGNGSSGNYVGRNKLDKATVNRFIPYVWTLDEEIEEVLTDHPQWLKVLREARRLAEENLDEVLLGMRNAMYGADMLRQDIEFDIVFECMVLNGLSDDDAMLLSKAKKLWKEPKKDVKPEPMSEPPKAIKVDMDAEPMTDNSDPFANY